MALRALNAFDEPSPVQARPLHPIVDASYPGDERDRAFAFHLVQGVLRWRLRLDWIIQQQIRFPFKNIEPQILNILRMALYQIYFMDRVPNSAAVDQAVGQTRRTGRERLTGLVNGILRAALRRGDSPPLPGPDTERLSYLSVVHSFPEWLVAKWVREWGLEKAERLLESSNQIPSVVIRVNRLTTDKKTLRSRLEASGAVVTSTSYCPDGLRIQGLQGLVSAWEGFQEGLFQVQGEAAQICTSLLSPKVGERVLEVGAGRGGKSTHCAEWMGGQGLVAALDIDHHRLKEMMETCRRLGIKSILAVCADATKRLSYLFRKGFDCILVDAPCSALGTLSKHPDGKWIRDEGDILRLSGIQKTMLSQASSLLAKGGRMLYVTCTLSREENEGVVHDFLGRNSGMALGDLKQYAPPWARDLVDDKGFFRTFPHVHGMDGFFGALCIRKE